MLLASVLAAVGLALFLGGLLLWCALVVVMSCRLDREA